MEKNTKYPKPSLTTKIPDFSNVKIEVHEKPVGEMRTIHYQLGTMQNTDAFELHEQIMEGQNKFNGTLTIIHRPAVKDTIKDMRDNHLATDKNDVKLK